MSIQRHFEADVIEQSDVLLDDQEQDSLVDFLEELIDLQNSGSPDMSVEDKIKNIAGLAFMAGRSYQKEEDGYAELGRSMNPQEEHDHGGKIPVYLSPVAAGRLIAYLLGDE